MTDTSTATVGVASARPRIQLGRFRDLALVPAIVVLLIVGALVDPIFLTPGNLINVLQQQSELSLLVLAQTLVLVAGKIDLSLESTIGLAPALAIGLIVPATAGGLGTEWSAALAIPLCLLIGAAIGAFNGFLILKLQLSAFIVTLGMLITVRGLQLGFTKGATLSEVPGSYTYLGAAEWFGLPASVWICMLLFVLGIVLLSKFQQGRSLYAIGGNIDAARAAGIRTSRVVWTVLIVAGLLAAIAGILMTGRLGGVGAAQGEGMIFQVFAAAVIGGVSLDGGKGTLFGALCGVLMLGLIQNILTLVGVDAQWIKAIYGAIILLALMLARLTTGKAQD